MGELPIFRTAREDDVEALFALAVAGGSGLTNLPPDRDALAAKVSRSAAALSDVNERERGSGILFVVEQAGQIVATSCVFARVGAEWPFYSYRLTRQSARSVAVGRVHAQTLLNLANDFDGEAEVGGLLVDPAVRGRGVGQLAARARYMFIGRHRAWFKDRVIAELRGWQDAEGHSPVWDAIGRQFYEMDFQEADRTGALAGNQFIADLGPRYPLYVSLLPLAAREALGRPHDEGRPALDMLRAEGFSVGDYVDIFDGGPTVVAEIDAVSSIRSLQHFEMTGTAQRGVSGIVSAGEAAEFRASLGSVSQASKLDSTCAARLGLEIGDHFQWIPTR